MRCLALHRFRPTNHPGQNTVAGADKRPPSRGACAPEFCESHWQEPASNREICSVSVRSPRRFEAQIKGSRTPPGAYLLKLPHQRVRPALSGARSPDGVPLRHLRQRPNATAQLQHVLPGTWLKSGRYPLPPVPVQRVHPRTGRDAGRTFSPKPPERRGNEPLPAGTALAPPDGVTGWRPVEERDMPL